MHPINLVQCRRMRVYRHEDVLPPPPLKSEQCLYIRTEREKQRTALYFPDTISFSCSCICLPSLLSMVSIYLYMHLRILSSTFCLRTANVCVLEMN
jgi:hypothetical protein